MRSDNTVTPVRAPRGILVASHPRSGTHLLLDILRRQFPSTRGWRWWGLPLDHLYLNVERIVSDRRHFGDEKAEAILRRVRMPLMKTHYLEDFSETWTSNETGPLPLRWREYVDKAVILYVHRDPRDVMVSYKQFLSSIQPGVAEMTLFDFMRSPHWSEQGDRLEWWKRHVGGWLGKPGVVAIAYRDLVKHTEREIARIAGELKERPLYRLPLLPAKRGTIMQTRMDRLFQLAPESTAIMADAKRYPAEPWRSALSPQEQQYVTDRLGSTMIALGYEGGSASMP